VSIQPSACLCAQLISIRDIVFAKYGQSASGGKPGAPAGAGGPAAGAAAGVGRKRGRSEMAPAGTAAAAPPSREDALASVRGTPIILVPAIASSLISIHNAHLLLERGIFVPPTEAAAMAAEVGEGTLRKRTITHTDSRGVKSRYHIVDDVSLLQRADW